MVVSFNILKYLVTVVATDLLNDDFGNLQDRNSLDSEKKEFISDASEEIYAKVSLLADLCNELLGHRPLSF